MRPVFEVRLFSLFRSTNDIFQLSPGGLEKGRITGNRSIGATLTLEGRMELASVVISSKTWPTTPRVSLREQNHSEHLAQEHVRTGQICG